jgi:hypothetical protein
MNELTDAGGYRKRASASTSGNVRFEQENSVVDAK